MDQAQILPHDYAGGCVVRGTRLAVLRGFRMRVRGLSDIFLKIGALTVLRWEAGEGDDDGYNIFWVGSIPARHLVVVHWLPETERRPVTIYGDLCSTDDCVARLADGKVLDADTVRRHTAPYDLHVRMRSPLCGLRGFVPVLVMVDALVGIQADVTAIQRLSVRAKGKTHDSWFVADKNGLQSFELTTPVSGSEVFIAWQPEDVLLAPLLIYTFPKCPTTRATTSTPTPPTSAPSSLPMTSSAATSPLR